MGTRKRRGRRRTNERGTKRERLLFRWRSEGGEARRSCEGRERYIDSPFFCVRKGSDSILSSSLSTMCTARALFCYDPKGRTRCTTRRYARPSTSVNSSFVHRVLASPRGSSAQDAPFSSPSFSVEIARRKDIPSCFLSLLSLGFRFRIASLALLELKSTVP